MITLLCRFLGMNNPWSGYQETPEPCVIKESYVEPPPQGRIPFIGWMDLAEIKIKLNHIPTEEGFEMIPSGYTAACGDEAYVESYTDEVWNRSNSNLIGWYPIPEGTNEKWRVVGGPCMRMARRKIS